MQKLQTASVYIKVPVTGPEGSDLTLLPASMAIIPEGLGEPGDADYHSAEWIGGEVAYKPAAADLAAGEYNIFVRLVAGAEDVRLLSGRLRNGDARI